MAAVGRESPPNGLDAGSEVELKGNVGPKTNKKGSLLSRESYRFYSSCPATEGSRPKSHDKLKTF